MYKHDLLNRLGIKERTFVDKYLDTAGFDNKDEYSDAEVALLEQIKNRVQDGKESHPAVKKDLENRKRQQQQQSQSTTNSNAPQIAPVVPTGDVGFLKTYFDALNEDQKRQFELAYQFHVLTTPHRFFEFMQEKRESGEYAQLMADSLRSFFKSATDAQVKQLYLDSPYTTTPIESDGRSGHSNSFATIDPNIQRLLGGEDDGGASIDETPNEDSS